MMKGCIYMVKKKGKESILFRTESHGKRGFRQRGIPIRKVGRRTNAKVNPALRLTVRDNPLALMGLHRAVIG